jgi:hypothetical protein
MWPQQPSRQMNAHVDPIAASLAYDYEGLTRLDE